MSSNRRSYNARKRRGGLTRTEHLQLAKKRGNLGTFREDAEANRQLQKEFAASGAYQASDGTGGINAVSYTHLTLPTILRV